LIGRNWLIKFSTSLNFRRKIFGRNGKPIYLGVQDTCYPSYNMARKAKIEAVKRISQQYAYSSLQLHETIARKAGFTGTDHKYLGFFLQKGSLTAGEVATLAGLTTGSVTGLIDRFEKKIGQKNAR
jgi:hypothetical protein